MLMVAPLRLNAEAIDSGMELAAPFRRGVACPSLSPSLFLVDPALVYVMHAEREGDMEPWFRVLLVRHPHERRRPQLACGVRADLCSGFGKVRVTHIEN